MRDQIKFGLIRNAEEFDSLKAFAESFGHKVGNNSILPIYTIERGDQMIGYFNLITYPIVCPAFHPRATSPRDFYDAVMFAKNHFCMNSIDGKFRYGTCLLALPKELAVNKSVLERCGFVPTKQELWQSVP